MAEQPRPPLPEGFQRPGVPGAGNLLDPEVRGELREKLHDAAQGARGQIQGAQSAPAESSEEERPAPPPSPPVLRGRGAGGEGDAPRETKTHRAGPFAHGDVDLSDLAANVTPDRPRRTRGRRRFYFLKDTMTAADDVAPKPPPGPKPG